MADEPQRQFAVIIINWNRKEDAEQAIRSVLRNAGEYQPDILLWDNGSTDGSVTHLQTAFAGQSHVQVHASPENDGVCVGRNKAVARTDADLLVFMDSDSILETPNAFGKIHDAFDNDDSLGILNFEIINLKGKVMWPFLRSFERWQKETFAITRVDGCGFAMRRSVFWLAGGFPEHFGYGAEEHYLARRCIGAGFRVHYFPHVSVTHMQAPGGRNSDQFVTMMRNHIWMPLELFPMPWAIISALRMTHSYWRDARDEQRMADFWRGLTVGFLGFKMRRRHPLSKEAWRRFRAIIAEDKAADQSASS